MRLIITFFVLFSFSLFGESTSHQIQLKDETLSYTATTGFLPVKDTEEKEKGQIHFIAYMKEGKSRPITFVFNGGPGSSSVWLHLGAFGPRRVLSLEEGQTKTPPYTLVDNEETLLDLTDLVFVDPIGTGLSRANSPEEAKAYYSVMGDIESLGDFIRDFLTAHKGWNRPLYLAGESYGTSRAAGLAHYLQSRHRIYLNGLILISCALDFQSFLADRANPLSYILHLPTYAVTAQYHKRYRPEATLEEVAEEARLFSFSSYALNFLCPPLTPAERELFYHKLASFTGLSYETVAREEGLIDNEQFLTEFFPGEKKVLGGYDTRLVGNAIHAFQTRFSSDPSFTSIAGILTAALHSYLHGELNSPFSYEIFSEKVHYQWDFHSHNGYFEGFPDFMGMLREALIVNPALKLFVGSGYFDAVTPFAATEYCFDHLNLPASYLENVEMHRYEGGHMYYLSPSARKNFRQDLHNFYRGN